MEERDELEKAITELEAQREKLGAAAADAALAGLYRRLSELVLPDAQLFQGRYEWLRGRPRKALEWWKRAVA